MGTKNNPGSFDCYANAEPDEPMFILLGRDATAAKLVKDWAEMRFKRLPDFGINHPEEMAQIEEAVRCAAAMQSYWTTRQQEKNRERIAGEKAAVAASEAAAPAEEPTS